MRTKLDGKSLGKYIQIRVGCEIYTNKWREVKVMFKPKPVKLSQKRNAQLA